MGQEQQEEEDYYSNCHDCTIHMHKLTQFLHNHCKVCTLMKIRTSRFFTTNIVAIRLIADGRDIWDNTSTKTTPLSLFADCYRLNYAALPTNSQFTERGVKESGYVTLGRRSEKNRTVLSTARALLIPNAMSAGNDRIDKGGGKKRSLQGKIRTHVLMEEAFKQQTQIDDLQRQDGDEFTKTHLSVVQ